MWVLKKSNILWIVRQLVVLLFAILMLGSALVGPAAGIATPSDEVKIIYTVSQTDGATAGQVELVVNSPDRVVEFDITPSSAVEVTAMDGFSKEGDNFAWDGRTAQPTLVYVIPASVATVLTATYSDISRNYIETNLSARYYGDPVDFTKETVIAGKGTTHSFSIALWDRAYSATSADGTDISVVAPPVTGGGSVAIFNSELQQLRDEYVVIDEFFQFDRGDDQLVVFVRPNDSAGLEANVVGSAGSSGIIQLEPSATTDVEVLAHEFTHTQQDFQTTQELNWFVEGSAQYLGQYYAYHTTDQSFQEFYDRISVSDEYATTDLRSLTNASEQADYDKGGHVAAGLDVEIRSRSDGTARLDAMLIGMREADGGMLHYADGRAISD
jgi:hypothetical protein